MSSIEEYKQKLSRYIIGDRLTATVSSSLYHAVDRETGQRVVIKQFLYSSEFDNEVAVSAKILSHGDNIHILPIIDTVQDEKYTIMPYMEGGDLWKLRINKGGLTPEQSFAIAAQVGLALQQVHAAGVIHNDIKTSNVLLADTGDLSNLTPLVKIIDFGLSCGGTLAPSWTAGTPEYMAPEKSLYSSKPTLAVDIYSLGLVVYEILSNTVLFWDRKFRDNFPYEKIPPHEMVPEKVLGVIRTACEINPNNRYKSAVEMISDLEKAVYSC